MLFTSNTKVENKFLKGEINAARNKWQCSRGRSYSSSSENFREIVKPPWPQTYYVNKNKSSLIFYSII